MKYIGVKEVQKSWEYIVIRSSLWIRKSLMVMARVEWEGKV